MGEKILLNDSCKLNCFYTPGHTKGSMCYEFVGKGKKILFTGDFLTQENKMACTDGIFE